MTPLPIDPTTLLDELRANQALLDKWIKHVEGGLPVIDAPGSEEDLMDLISLLANEITLVSGKLDSLANILRGE